MQKQKPAPILRKTDNRIPSTFSTNGYMTYNRKGERDAAKESGFGKHLVKYWDEQNNNC